MRKYPVSDIVGPLSAIDGQKFGPPLDGVLVDLIRSTIAKDSWQEAGGEASIQYFPAEKSMQISQYQEIHEEIGELLATLRKLQELVVNAEIHFVHASSKLANQWQKAITQGQQTEALSGQRPIQFHDPNSPIQFGQTLTRAVPLPKMKTTKTHVVLLDGRQVAKLLEATEADRHCSIVRAPKLNIDNGQVMSFECMKKQIMLTEFRTPKIDYVPYFSPFAKDQKPDYATVALGNSEKISGGWCCSVQPTVAPDRRSVRFAMNVEHFDQDAKSVERTMKANTTVAVSDGRTLVWDLGENAGQHLFVLVTPRVVVREVPTFIGELQPVPGR
jgi:hypothetical protein